MRITAWLDNSPIPTQNSQVNFDVLIGNVCEGDVISFTDQIEDVYYMLRRPTAPFGDSFTLV